ncbi:MAG: class B sortase [Clostridia bacterium]|nr:class B sortase [Clostridia bacterium]
MNEETKPRPKRRGKIRLGVALMLALCLCAAACLGCLGVMGLLEQREGTAYYSSLASAMRAEPETGATPGERTPSQSEALLQRTPWSAASADEAAPENEAEKPEASKANRLAPPDGTAALQEEPENRKESERKATASPAPQTSESPEGREKMPVEIAAPLREADEERKANLSELDFEALRADCPDAVGWIRIEGTVIDYPIVQGEDNIFYLKHLPDGTPNAAGSILMDRVNAPDFSDDVTILHGHHMRSGAMFGDLDEYKREAYYLAHPTMRLFTPDGDYDVAIFAAYSVDGATFAYPTVFSGEEGFTEFLNRALSRTPWSADVDVRYGDRLLMLSTCAYAYENERFLVVGKILDEPEE